MVVNPSAYRPRVAFQGEHGAFSEEAAIKLLGPDIELVPRPTFASLFRSLDEGLADYALAPVENSLIGIIRPSFDLFEKSSLVSIGEVVMPIAQHLIACPGGSFAEIEVVQSHPAALAQCARFFIENPQLQKIEAEDTAGSVATIIAHGDRKLAAIAGRRAAELYGGTILKENIQDRHDNQTRFLLLSGSAEWSPLLNNIAESKRNTNHDL
jgi:prephenate dehydratase